MPCWVGVSKDSDEGLLGIEDASHGYEANLQELGPSEISIERSIMSSKEEAGAVVGVSDWVDSVWPERRGVVLLGDDI